MDRAPTIEVSELRKTYGDVVALDGVTFSVEPGEVVGFLGPNGAGKTTTMKILTGFISATEGSARVAGLDVCADSLEVRRRIGYLPENAPVYRDMAVRDYLRFVCDVRGLSKAERERRIRATSGQVGLDSVLDRPIQELSKGFRQRVGLAQALVHDPEILILDEPTTGLDPNQIADIRDLIIEIGRTRTVLLSTHILQEVKAVCGRVLIVSKGRIVGCGPPAVLVAAAAGGSGIDVVRRAAGDVAGAIAALPNVTEVRDGAGEGPGTIGLTVTADGASDPRDAIFALAVERGWTLLHMNRQQRSLEDAFRELTTA